ncbi:hypothetical protein KC992_03470 [Candidatus Saccharibacteria bacterium]|nr:hypothetical protein [Candidatus Saccharibacteria bacterium]MCA9328632.1 hypothetical protein [Candidatus Saccharibacteria bacterium]
MRQIIGHTTGADHDDTVNLLHMLLERPLLLAAVAIFIGTIVFLLRNIGDSSHYDK